MKTSKIIFLIGMLAIFSIISIFIFFPKHQTAITWIMQHSVIIMLATMALSIIVLFAKLPDVGF